MTTPRKAPKKGARQATLPAAGGTERAAVQRPFAKLGALVGRRAASAAPEETPRKASDGAPREPGAKRQEERLRFAQLMRGVKPLRSGARRVPTSLEDLEARPAQAGTADEKKAASEEEALDRGARARLEAFVAEGVRFEVVDDGESLEGRRLDVDPREIRKLRQLRYALDGTLDLHGLDAAEARAKLESFLRRRRLQGDRAVLVVHGKGKHSPRGYAVLRGEIAAWLSQGRAQRDVAAFASVPERDGVAGAVCVLLSR